MRTLTPAYLEAAKAAGRYPNVKAVIENVGTLNGNNEILELHITKGTTAKPEYFDTMLALSATCRITVDRRRIADESNIVAGKSVEVYAAFNRPDGVEIGSALIGTFYMSSYDNSDIINGIITANDGILYTGVDFNPEGLTYPLLMSDLLTEAFRQSGYTLSGVTLDIDPHVKRAPYKAEEPVAEGMQGSPYTCREIISRIAAINLGALYMDEHGAPQTIKYTTVGNNVVNNNMILDFRHGSENFGITQIRIFKSEERMAKKNTSYKKLAYAPRFENMDSISSGSDWHDEIDAAASEIVGKSWTTGTLTMRGVGELEIGDIVTIGTTNLLISGIVYDFVNGCFNETLYSFAWTYEEYLMSHPPIVNNTGTVKMMQIFASALDPILQSSNIVRVGDVWNALKSATSNEIVKSYKRVKNTTTGEDEWQEQYTVPTGGSGVGRNVGNHNEIFNVNEGEADSSTINGDSRYDYNHATGRGHTINGSNNTSVGGYHNSVSGGYCLNVYGAEITVAGLNPRCSWIAGDTLTVQGSGITSSVIVGQSSTVSTSNCRANIISVSSGTIGGDIYSSIIETQDSTVLSMDSSIFVGKYSNIGGNIFCSAIFGYDHAISTAYQALVSGRGASVTNSTRMAIGDGTKQSPENIFHIDSSGNVTATSYNTFAADYAEMFEWADGNRDNADRRGMLVALYGDMILPAHGDDFFGVVSAAPSVIGNNPQHWHKRYKKDVFGAEIRDEKGERIESDEYDPDREYIPRSERPEWSPVGMVGRLVIVDDGSCKVGGYVSARHGVGTKCYSKTAAKVLKRIDDHHVEVLMTAR